MGEEPAKTDDLWPTWRRLIKAMPVARMPLEFFFSPSMWALFGADFMSGLLKNGTTKAVFAILEPLPQRELRRLHALAFLNHRRQEAVSRWFAIAFVTLPASAALTLSELSPETLRAVASADGLARWYLMLTYAGFVVALYMMFAWRARQLHTLIEMWLIQRGLDPRGDAGDEGDPLAQPIG